MKTLPFLKSRTSWLTSLSPESQEHLRAPHGAFRFTEGIPENTEGFRLLRESFRSFIKSWFELPAPDLWLMGQAQRQLQFLLCSSCESCPLTAVRNFRGYSLAACCNGWVANNQAVIRYCSAVCRSSNKTPSLQPYGLSKTAQRKMPFPPNRQFAGCLGCSDLALGTWC